MIPLRDNIPSRTFPIVNTAVIVVCSVVYLMQAMGTFGEGKLAEQYGMVPARVTEPGEPVVLRQSGEVQTPYGRERVTIERSIAEPPLPPWMTFVTCMFLHGSLMHFLGNMWFLWIFGDNVEDRLGRIGYGCLYLGTGLAAGLAHYITDVDSGIPTIGASGAIAGVMGAYLYFYPHAKVQAVLPIVIILQVFTIPAPVFLGLWFVFQTVSGLQALGSSVAGGVAWWAHIGGFVAGAAAAYLLGRTPLDHGDPRLERF